MPPRPSRNLDRALLAPGRALFPQRGCAVFAGDARAMLDSRRCAREARQRRGLSDAVDDDERSACGVVGMGWSFGKTEHRRKADLGAFEEFAPFVARSGPENLLQTPLQSGPLGPVHLIEEIGIVGQTELLEQRRIKRWLD